MQLGLLCHPGWLAKRCDEFAGARNELRRISEDVKLHKRYLYRSSLLDSLRSASAVA